MEDWKDMIDGLQTGNIEFLDEFKPTDLHNPSQTHTSNIIYNNNNNNISSVAHQMISPKISSSSSSSFGEHQPPFWGSEPKNDVLMMTSESCDDDGGGSGNNCMLSRSPSVSFSRSMAERKRRERFAELMISLSSIIPGLKKIDKLSILGEAIKYLKYLQERVEQLEKQANTKSEKSTIFLNTSNISPDDESRSEIEARISENNVLIRVHCEKKKGFLIKTIREIEKHNLLMVNSSVLPFGNYAMDITIVAQTNSEYNMKVQDLVKNLHSALI